MEKKKKKVLFTALFCIMQLYASEVTILSQRWTRTHSHAATGPDESKQTGTRVWLQSNALLDSSPPDISGSFATATSMHA